MMTVLDSLAAEYRRRHAALPPVSAHHASYVFLLDGQGEVHPLPHALNVALVRGEAAAPDFAGQTLRLAEWYVRLKEGEPEMVVNETYGLVTFDGQGRVDWSATPAFHPRRAAGPPARRPGGPGGERVAHGGRAGTDAGAALCADTGIDGLSTRSYAMEHPFHPFHELFEQLGLGSSPGEIRSFLQAHAPLPGGVALPDAPFWNPAQAVFLREALDADSDWAEAADALNAALRRG